MHDTLGGNEETMISTTKQSPAAIKKQAKANYSSLKHASSLGQQGKYLNTSE